MLEDANNAYNANSGHLAAGGEDQTPSCSLYALVKRIQHTQHWWRQLKPELN